MLHIRRTLTGVGYLGIAVALVTGVNPILAVAHPPPTNAAHQTYTDPQPPSKADFSGHGANTHGPYDSTRSGAPSLNGNGKGKAVGKPCAGCVGNADDKNPKGQMPNGSDHNAGYECDRNHGIGRTNPAHTGCRAGETAPAAECPGGDMNGSEAGCGKPTTAPGNECPGGERLGTALTHSAALALKMLAVVNPQFTEISKLADKKAAEKCGETAGAHQNNGNPHEKITICH